MFPVVWVVLLLAVIGFVFQSVLPSPYRFVIYPISLLLGIFTALEFNYYTIAFNLGMMGRAASGGYWHCVAMEAVAAVFGFIVGFWALS
jgi:hypothetical protein